MAVPFTINATGLYSHQNGERFGFSRFEKNAYSIIEIHSTGWFEYHHFCKPDDLPFVVQIGTAVANTPKPIITKILFKHNFK